MPSAPDAGGRDAYGLGDGAIDTPLADAAAEDAASVDAPSADAAQPDAAHDDQRPPTGREALEAWLAEGSYLAWHCEPDEHAARPPGAHGATRICSNDTLSGATSGDFPPGSASVKELYDRVGGAIIGYALAVKLEAGAGGDGWYWYERMDTTLYADGTGVALCTGCHVGADSSFAPTSRDYVFTVVP